jgi:predicted DsbA family dithiol-disulfide isomerase
VLSPDDLEQLDCFLDGDSPPEERAALSRALQERPELARGLERLRRLHAMLEVKDSPPVSAAPDPAIAQVLGQRARPFKLRPGWLVAAAALAGLGAWAYVAVYHAPAPLPPPPPPDDVRAWPSPGTELQTPSPGHVSLSSGTVVLDGAGMVAPEGVEFHAFRDAMMLLTPRFDECFQKGLALNPKLQGDVSVMVHLVDDSGRGRVDEARIEDDYTLENPFVSSCLLEVLSKADFPAPRRADIPWISWPLQFHPATGASNDARVSMLPAERLERVAEFDLAHVDAAPAPDHRGGSNPAVVIYEFSDFECSYCLKAHQALDELYRRYQDRALFIFRPMRRRTSPIADRAVASLYAAGEQGKFWELAEALYGNGELLSPESIRAAASAVRLDWAKLQRDAASAAIAEQLARDRALVEAHHLKAAPIVFINGRELVGVRPVEEYERVIREELDAGR